MFKNNYPGSKLYHQQIKHFREYSINKRWNTVKAILPYFKQPSLSELSFLLDVGSGDGDFLEDLILSFNETHPEKKLSVTSIEPDSYFYEVLKKKKFEKKYPVLFELKKTLIQFFKSDKYFDLITCTHAFYHIPPEEWCTVSQKLVDMLKPDHYLLIVIDSKEGIIYKNSKKFIPPIKRENKIDLFGEMIFGEDILKELKSAGFKPEYRILNSELELRQPLDLVNTISLTHKYPQETLLEKGVLNGITRFFSELKGEKYKRLPWKESLIIIKRS